MHETELCVQEVQIEMQTLATLPPDYQLVRRTVAMHHERLAGFQHREDANQTLVDRIPFSHGPCPVFLRDAAGLRRGGLQVLVGPARSLGQLLHMGFQRRRGLLDKPRKILEQHPLARQKARKGALGEQVAQVAPENDPVEHGQRTGNLVFMNFEKRIHGPSLQGDRSSHSSRPTNPGGISLTAIMPQRRTPHYLLVAAGGRHGDKIGENRTQFSIGGLFWQSPAAFSRPRTAQVIMRCTIPQSPCQTRKREICPPKPENCGSH